MSIEISLLIGLLGLATSMFFSNKSAKRTTTKDIEERTASITKMEMNIAQMTKSLEKLVEDLVDTKGQLADHNLRITITESGLKDTARTVSEVIDKHEELEKRVTKLEG